MKLGPLIAAILIAGGAGAAGYWVKNSVTAPSAQSAGGGGPAARRRQATGAAPVAVAKVTQQSVPVYRDGIGNVLALNTVTVRAQVDGRLLSVEFAEGQDVKKGAVLARIDPVIYKSQFDQAVAKKAQDEANLANAKIDLERYTKLAKTSAGPQQQADQQAAMVAQLGAQVQADQAAIDNAKATLDYTTIISPLDGRTGLRLVDPGNIVHSSDTTGIVSLTQMKPMGVLFTLPQRDLAVTQQAFAAGKVVVQIPNTDGTKVDATGTLQSIDNQIDQTTGTIKLKAQFPNEDLKLWPGQFVAVRVIVDTLTNVTVVPATAIRRGVNGNDTFNFVYVVGDDNVAHIKRLKVPQQDEKLAVIEGDVAVGQSVVTEGFTQLTDGKAVTVSTPANTTGADPATPATPTGDRAARDGAKGDWKSRKGGNGSPPADAKASPSADHPDAGKHEKRRRDEAQAERPDGGGAKGTQP